MPGPLEIIGHLPVLAIVIWSAPGWCIEGYTRGLVLGQQTFSAFLRSEGIACLMVLALPPFACRVLGLDMGESLLAGSIGLPAGIAAGVYRFWRTT